MVKKYSKLLIFTVVIAAAALFAVTPSKAFVCEDLPLVPDNNGVYICPENLEGTCCATIDVPGLDENIVVEVVPDFGNYDPGPPEQYDGTLFFPDNSPTVYTEEPGETGLPLCTDNKGNEVSCIGNTYLIHKPLDVVITHVGLSYPANVELEQIYPNDRSTSIGSSCKGWLDDVNSLNAVCSNAIKVISNDKDVFSVGFSQNGADVGSILLIASDYGYLTGQILTPAGCEAAHVTSSITVGGYELKFDPCSGDFIPSSLTDLGFIPVRGSICEAEEVSSEPLIVDILENKCDEILKSGPNETAYLNMCVQWTNIDGRSEGYMATMIGFGDQLFLGPFDINKPCSDDPYKWQPDTIPDPTPSACQSEVIYDDEYQVITDCNESSATFGDPICSCTPPQEGSPCTQSNYDSGVCRPFQKLGENGFHKGACFDTTLDRNKINFDECSLIVEGGFGTEPSTFSNAWYSSRGWWF